MPEEAGYYELRRLFDYLKDTGLVGPAVCGQDNSGIEIDPEKVEICVIDADDLLDDPEGIMRQYCTSIGLDFNQSMLNWDSEDAHEFAKQQFEKWDGFHDDAINSRDLKPRQHVSWTQSSLLMMLYADGHIRNARQRLTSSYTLIGLRNTAKRLPM